MKIANELEKQFKLSFLRRKCENLKKLKEPKLWTFPHYRFLKK